MARSSAAQRFKTKSSGARLEGSLTDAIDALNEHIKTKVLRSAAHAGAIVFYEEMETRAPVDEGDLRDSIYRYHDDKKSTDTFQRYYIGPNMKKAPHWFNVEYGHWRYNAIVDGIPQKSKSRKNARVGTIGVADPSVHDLPGALDVPVWTPASPYIRPTFDSVARSAIEEAQLRAAERLREFKYNPDAA